VYKRQLYDWAPLAAGAVAVIGAVTALFAATIGMVQVDIKRILAYSTMSQIGYMFLAVASARTRRACSTS